MTMLPILPTAGATDADTAEDLVDEVEILDKDKGLTSSFNNSTISQP